MKKLLLIALLAIPCTAGAQSIGGDAYSGDDHVVITDKKICRSMTDKMVLSVGLSGVRDKDGKDLIFLDLKITSSAKIIMPAGNYMTIQLFSGEEFKLHVADYDTSGLVREIHDINGFIIHDYSVYPSFVITPKQIEDIISKGVKRLQCNTSPNMYAKDFKKDQIGKALSERWQLLKQSLNGKK